MQTNTRAIVSAFIALAILILRNFLPDVSEQLGGLETPLIDFVIALLAAYAGLYTTPPAYKDE